MKKDTSQNFAIGTLGQKLSWDGNPCPDSGAPNSLERDRELKIHIREIEDPNLTSRVIAVTACT